MERIYCKMPLSLPTFRRCICIYCICKWCAALALRLGQVWLCFKDFSAATVANMASRVTPALQIIRYIGEPSMDDTKKGSKHYLYFWLTYVSEVLTSSLTWLIIFNMPALPIPLETFGVFASNNKFGSCVAEVLPKLLLQLLTWYGLAKYLGLQQVYVSGLWQFFNKFHSFSAWVA